MLLHQELRKAREQSGLTQGELAIRVGIPRNQIVRAERGENITLDTLRKIAAHLPVENLTLMEKAKLNMDYLPEPEKVYFSAMETVAQVTMALGSALRSAQTARSALVAARAAEPLPGSQGGTVDLGLILNRLQDTYHELETKLKTA